MERLDKVLDWQFISSLSSLVNVAACLPAADYHLPPLRIVIQRMSEQVPVGLRQSFGELLRARCRVKLEAEGASHPMEAAFLTAFAQVTRLDPARILRAEGHNRVDGLVGNWVPTGLPPVVPPDGLPPVLPNLIQLAFPNNNHHQPIAASFAHPLPLTDFPTIKTFESCATIRILAQALKHSWASGKLFYTDIHPAALEKKLAKDQKGRYLKIEAILDAFFKTHPVSGTRTQYDELTVRRLDALLRPRLTARIITMPHGAEARAKTFASVHRVLREMVDCRAWEGMLRFDSPGVYSATGSFIAPASCRVPILIVHDSDNPHASSPAGKVLSVVPAISHLSLGSPPLCFYLSREEALADAWAKSSLLAVIDHRIVTEAVPSRSLLEQVLSSRKIVDLTRDGDGHAIAATNWIRLHVTSAPDRALVLTTVRDALAVRQSTLAALRQMSELEVADPLVLFEGTGYVKASPNEEWALTYLAQFELALDRQQRQYEKAERVRIKAALNTTSELLF